jgi:hypothetical protein
VVVPGRCSPALKGGQRSKMNNANATFGVECQ